MTVKLCECGCGEPAPIARYSVAWKGWVKGHPKRFISGHNSKGAPPDERFWAKVVKGEDCWLWTDAPNYHGYGRFRIAPGNLEYAHRYSYERLIGPIPEGLHIDHLCRNRMCVNPEHMEPVTIAENLRRGRESLALEAQLEEAG